MLRRAHTHIRSKYTSVYLNSDEIRLELEIEQRISFGVHARTVFASNRTQITAFRSKMFRLKTYYEIANAILFHFQDIYFKNQSKTYCRNHCAYRINCERTRFLSHSSEYIHLQAVGIPAKFIQILNDHIEKVAFFFRAIFNNSPIDKVVYWMTFCWFGNEKCWCDFFCNWHLTSC